MNRQAVIVLGLVVAAGIVALVLTGGQPPSGPGGDSADGEPSGQTPLSGHAEARLRQAVHAFSRVDDKRLPLADAVVQAVPEGRARIQASSEAEWIRKLGSDFRTARTGPDGRAVLEGIDAGPWLVRIYAPSHLAAVQVFHARAGAQDPWALTLEKLARIEGRVLDFHGELAPDTQVGLIVPPRANTRRVLSLHPSDRSKQSSKTVADAEGRFAFDIVPAGHPLRLLCTNAERGRCEHLIEEPLTPGETRHVEVNLDPVSTIIGKIPRPAGEPAHVTVECLHVTDDGSGRIAEQRVVVTEGVDFKLYNLKPGRKLLVYAHVVSHEITLGHLYTECFEGKTTDVGTIPVLSSVLEIVVLPEGGAPDLQVELSMGLSQGEDVEQFRHYEARMRAETELTLIGWPAGKFNIMAHVTGENADAFEPGNVEMEPFDGTHGRFEIVLPKNVKPAGRMELTVDRQASPLSMKSDVRAALFRDGLVAASFPRLWPEGMRFRFEHLAEGEYVLEAFADRAWVLRQKIHLRDREERAIKASGWQREEPLRGEVVDARGRPVAGALVVLEGPPVPRRSAPPFMRIFDTKADDEGVYRIPRYRTAIRARVSAYRPETGSGVIYVRDWDAAALPRLVLDGR